MSSVRDFGAKGDGKTDDTQALHHALQSGDGELVFPRGDYAISKPLYIPLEQHGRVSLQGAGGTARLIMRGPGPAIHLVGTHKKSALPAHFEEKVWTKERMPAIDGLEILGEHAQADGIRAEGVMQPTFTRLLIRHCRHGIHLANRDRNVIVADCHIYDNSGIGIFFDKVNLHQTNIHGNHISYCKQGGIRVAGSEIRNIQICSNDIEYNFDLKNETSSDVLFDCRDGTVREGTIVGNTIQASKSPNGANIRLIGKGKDDPSAVGLLAITGNLLGSQETVLHFQACRGVVVSGNCIYSGYHRALWAEDCEHLVLSGNSLDHNPEYRGKSTDHVLLQRCRNVNLSGLILQHTREPAEAVDASVEVQLCKDVSVTGCQLIAVRGIGIAMRASSMVRVADCTIRGPADGKGYKAAITVDDRCDATMVTNCFLARGSDGTVVDATRKVVVGGNVALE